MTKVWQVLAYPGGFINSRNVYEKSCSSCCHGYNPSRVPSLPSSLHPHPQAVGWPPSPTLFSVQSPSLSAFRLQEENLVSRQGAQKTHTQAESTWHPNICMECVVNKQMFLLQDSRCLGRTLGLKLEEERRIPSVVLEKTFSQVFSFHCDKGHHIPHHHFLVEGTVPRKKASLLLSHGPNTQGELGCRGM